MWVGGRFRQELGDDPLGESAGPLVLFQNDIYSQTGFDVFSILSVHDGFLLKGGRTSRASCKARLLRANLSLLPAAFFVAEYLAIGDD